MPRILEDPTQAVCPSFEGAEWDLVRQALIDAHPDNQPLTAEEAIQHMKDAWGRGNDLKVAAWNAQLEQDRVEREEQDRLANEEEATRRARRDREDEEQRQEAEKKKLKLNSFDEELAVDEWIEPRPASYALNKINNLEYVELDYFTVKGCREAAADSSGAVSHDTLTFTQLEDTIAIRPLASLRPSRNIRNDEELSWGEMFEAKNNMLHFMAKSGVWQDEHAKSLAAFYVNLELHPRKRQDDGRQALILYQSRVRREWFDALKRNEGFNIALIQDNLLRSLAEQVTNSIRAKEIDQVRIPPSLTTQRSHAGHSLPSFPRSLTPSSANSPRRCLFHCLFLTLAGPIR